jgi:hypothetical protein
MNLLIPIEAFDNFKEVRNFPASSITPELIKAVKSLDEREELEPFTFSKLPASMVAAISSFAVEMAGRSR